MKALLVLFGIALSVEGVSDATYPYQPRQSVQWPRPRSGYVERTEDWVCLSSSFSVTPAKAFANLDKTVMARAKDDLAAVLDGKSEDADCLLDKKGGKKVANILTTINVEIENSEVALAPGVDETYTLELEKGKTAVSVKAGSVWGARHALATLANMLEVRNFSPQSAAANAVTIPSSDASHHHILPYSSFKISDGPRLGHRGVMIDTSRSFQPISNIERTLRTMAKAKLNVLHIHATDDQSFPLLIGKSAPLIHGDKCTETGPVNGGICAGAYSNYHTYTKKQMQDIIDLGRTYGIRVIIEIDQPAHARSWASTDTSLRECDDLEHQTSDYCAEPICGPLALNKNWDEVVKLAHLITDDWLALQTDPYMHYGMDEVKPGCWGESKTEELAMKYLEDAVEYLHKKDPSRRMVVWQDGVAPEKHQLPSQVLDYKVIAQVWNDPAVAQDILSQGTDIIWSNANAMYLDCGRGNPAVVNYTSWCSPYKTWWTIYKETPDLALTTSASGSGQVLGGEVALWAEQANAEVFDSLLWPRAAAWGGAAWEARSELLQDAISDQEIAALYRSEAELRKFTNIIVASGVAATAQYTEWCVFENKTLCDHYSLAYFGPDGPEITTTKAPSSAFQRYAAGILSLSLIGFITYP